MSYCKIFGCLLAILVVTGASFAQEFPIAVGSDNTFNGGGAFDGTNYCILIQGDEQSEYNLTAQFVSRSGSLVGTRISLGQAGSNPVLAFDGSKYLAVWTDIFPRMASGDTNGIGNLYGQFISLSGSLLGPSFTLVTGVNIKFGQGRGGLTFQDTTYQLFYCKGGNHIDHVYGQRISRSGALLGEPVQISEGYGREVAFAFDGTNYLVAWCKVDHPDVDRYIYGQFVNPSGALVGTNFLIDGGIYASDNPVSMAFDGSNYWVAFHEQAADTTGRWNLFARFVSPAGTIADRFTICDSTKSPTYASAAFDGTHYLITWMEFAGMPCVRGQFFTPNGIPVDTAFTVFTALPGKFPLGGVGGFVDGHFFLSATFTDPGFTDGDVYGLFLSGSTTGISENTTTERPNDYTLSQNYPNPFNPSTSIKYTVGGPGCSGLGASRTRLVVYDLLGREVAVLVNERKSAGSYEVKFDASGLPSGVYFYRLQAGSFADTKKLMLIR
jgi:hypothetical protein